MARRIRPADYPPPFDPAEVIVPPIDPADERIEVGVLIVGAGPGGLACAIRLGQLLEESPETAERLGDVHDEAVYLLTRNTALRVPPPPTMRNHRNIVASVSQLGRFLAEQAEEGGAAILPETDAQKLLVSDGRVHGIRTGDKGRGRNGERLPNFEPGSDIVARVTVLAEGTQGHLTGAAISRFGLEGRFPQIWALGVKEVWRVAKPLERIIHTMGWPLRKSRKYGEFGGSFI